MTPEERFWAKVNKTETCWLWTATITVGGYGQVAFSGKRVSAHRVAWFIDKGSWPEHQLDHLCRVRHCVRPDHLEDVTQRENILRGTGWAAINAARTTCAQGHPFSGENLRIDKHGRRRCRECNRANARRAYANRVTATAGADRG